MAGEGTDTHGEATFCVALLDEGARVLDAGCGTGRVAIRLTELGFDCVGVDVDESMLAVAREAAPGIAWFQGDLASVTSLDLGDPEPLDMVVLAGNVVPLLAPGTVGHAVGGVRRGLHSSATRAGRTVRHPGSWAVHQFRGRLRRECSHGDAPDVVVLR